MLVWNNLKSSSLLCSVSVPCLAVFTVSDLYISSLKYSPQANTSSSIYGFCFNLSLIFLFQTNFRCIIFLCSVKGSEHPNFEKISEIQFGHSNYLLTRQLIHRIFIDTVVFTYSNSSFAPVKHRNNHYLMTKENGKVTSAVNFILSKFVLFT